MFDGKEREIVGRELHSDSAEGLLEGAFKTTPTATAVVCAVLECPNDTP